MQFLLIKEREEKGIKLLFGKVKEEIINNNNVLIIPINKQNTISKSIIKKTIKRIKEINANRIILSPNLNKIDILKQEIMFHKIELVEGAFLFKMLLNIVLDYICKNANKKVQNLNVSILTNNLDAISKQIIIDIAKRVKHLNIVTNRQKEFEDIEEYLLEEMGIIIKLSHTIDKNSNIIINLDLNLEELNKYSIPFKSIIINIKENIKINSKRFNGININNYAIEIPTQYKIKGFEDKLIYETIIVNKNYKEVIEQIKKDNIRIKNLIGERGIIKEQEFSKW